jgi:serine/threonine protein kinase
MRTGLELSGRYRLEAPVGRGGMGEVWRGVDLRLRRPVAVKILPLSGPVDGAGVARFRREAEIAAAVNHPGITTVFDIDEHIDGGLRLFFLVMELMHGRDLASVLAGHPDGSPITQVTDWAAQILAALAAAHRQGVVHRDIKPANLFLTDDGQVKVCDFGISRLADATRITATGAAAGTPLYMAPEQIEGHDVDQRADLYALGCVLYHLLTGATWMDPGSGIVSVLHQHLNRAPAPPRSLRPDIDDHLSNLVLDLLAKHPDDRPKDAATVAERLRGLDSRPTLTGPEPPLQKSRREQPNGGTRPAEMPTMIHAPQPTGRPAGALERPTARATSTAIAMAMLCLLTIPVIPFATVQAIDLGALTSGDAVMRVTMCMVEALILATGALLLFLRKTAGRWLIAIGGAGVTLHAGTDIISFGDGVGRAPLGFLILTAVALMAGLPTTDR